MAVIAFGPRRSPLIEARATWGRRIDWPLIVTVPDCPLHRIEGRRGPSQKGLFPFSFSVFLIGAMAGWYQLTCPLFDGAKEPWQFRAGKIGRAKRIGIPMARNEQGQLGVS